MMSSGTPASPVRIIRPAVVCRRKRWQLPSGLPVTSAPTRSVMSTTSRAERVSSSMVVGRVVVMLAPS
jgi:hypothetical protein